MNSADHRQPDRGRLHLVSNLANQQGQDARGQALQQHGVRSLEDSLKISSPEPGVGMCGQDPMAPIVDDHELQLELCDVLEHIANGLPDDVRVALALVAVSILRKGFPRHMAFEERVVFPLFRKRSADYPDLEPVLQQLEAEHELDESFAYEIADELEIAAGQGRARNAEMLGYMLRGFFVSQRRHIEWENATIVPMARRIFTLEDWGEFQAGLKQHGAWTGHSDTVARLKALRADTH